MLLALDSSNRVIFVTLAAEGAYADSEDITLKGAAAGEVLH